MSELEHLLDQLVQKWRRDDVDIRSGVLDDEIRAFEQRFNVEVPPDVVTYLRSVDGMPENAMDAGLFRFWQLREFDAASAVLACDAALFDGYFVFADHSIAAEHFGISMGRTSPGAVAMIGDRPWRVASSFKQFIERYLRDSDALLRPERDLNHPGFVGELLV
jgi:hypothetical protein